MFSRRVPSSVAFILSYRSGEVLELYPKQDYLNDDGFGSLVRLPLGIHRKTGQRYHFINPDGTPLSPTIRDQIRVLSQPSLVSPDFINSLLERAPHWEQVAPTPTFVRVEGRTDLPLSEALKGAISVFDFVSRYIELNAKGVGICPFHDDHEHSFSVDKEDNYWHCFAGCGGGSIIDFWMKWRDLNGQDASFTSTIKEMREMLLTAPKPRSKRKKF
jgi:hypothetical protein